MRKRNREPIWQPKHAPTETAPKIPVPEKLAAYVVSFRKLLLELSLIAVAVVGLGLLVKEVVHEEIILEPIEIPDDIAKQGYTDIVVAEQIADAALTRQQEVRDLSEQKQWFKKEMTFLRPVATNIHTPDIIIPGTPFSLRAVARFIRHELNLPSTYIHGELIHDQNNLSLSLRNLSEPTVPAIRIDKNIQDKQALMQESGDALLKLTTPSSLALLSYFKFADAHQSNKKTNPDYDNVVQAVEYCLKYLPTSDDSFANDLWGTVFYNLDRFDEALEKFRRATEIKPNYGYIGWGAILYKQRKYDQAIAKFQKASELEAEKLENILQKTD